MGVVEVVVWPKDITGAVAGCSWAFAAVMTPRVTMPLAAIAAACHLSHRFSIPLPPFRSFAASPPRETVLQYSHDVYPPCLGFFFGASGKGLEGKAHQISPGCSGLGRCALSRRRAAAPSADALRALHGGQIAWQLLGSSSAPPLATLMMWSTWVACRVHAGPRTWHWYRSRSRTVRRNRFHAAVLVTLLLRVRGPGHALGLHSSQVAVSDEVGAVPIVAGTQSWGLGIDIPPRPWRHQL